MPMAKIFAALLASLFLVHANAGIESQHLNLAQTLPVAIRSVKSCGAWEAEGRNGQFRLIVADVSDGVGSELYVQWITVPTKDKPPAVVQTVAIRELNDDHAQYDFLSVDCEQKGKASYVRARAYFEHDERPKVHIFSIRLFGMGQYELTEQQVERVRSKHPELKD